MDAAHRAHEATADQNVNGEDLFRELAGALRGLRRHGEALAVHLAALRAAPDHGPARRGGGGRLLVLATERIGSVL